MSMLNVRIISRCLERIKEMLKSRNISYAKLAEALEVSEVTVKRMLNQDDISMDRLLTLADIVDCNLSELLSEVERESADIKCFSKEQDAAFTKYPHLFQYFMELSVRKKTPEEISDKYNLNEVSNYLYLRALENLELLSLLPENKVQFKSDSPMTFSPDSQFSSFMMVTSIQQACEAMLAPERDERYTVSAIIVPESEYEKLVNEVTKLLGQFVKTTARKNITVEGVPLYQVIMVGHPFEMYPDLDIIDVENGHFS